MFQLSLSRRAILSAVASTIATLLVPVLAQATPYQVTLVPADVIGSSGAYNSSFLAGNILDNQSSPTITETFANSYWINPDGGPGPGSAYITVDMQAATQITKVELFNTSNGGIGDRGTGNFQILGGNTVLGGQLTGSTTVLVSGTLAAASGNTINGQFFTVTDTGGYRYLEFQPLSVASAGNPCCGANVYGLDELRVFTPEPGSLVLLGLGTLGIGLVATRRRNANQLIRRAIQISAACLVACVLGSFATTANASQLVNIANGAPVVGGAGDYNSGAFNTGGTYQTSNVTNGLDASPNNNIGSTMTEPGQDGSFWLGQQGQTTGSFVLDLGFGAPQIGGFEIFNTRNGPYDDRGTGNFAIYGSNTVTTGSPASLGQVLVSPTLLASGTLTTQTYVGAFNAQGNTPLVADEFTSLNHGQFRYIEFQALSIGAALDKGVGSPGGVGLNELRIFSSPEPGSLVLLGLGVLGIGLTAHRRRRA